MHTSSSANRTCRQFSSASESAATVLMPSSRHAPMTRSPISPRLAMRIFLNIGLYRPEGEQPFAVLHGLAVLHVGADDVAVVLRRDLVHQLHRLDDAEDLILLDPFPDLHE